MKIYNPKVLTTALSAGVFALGSFAAMNAYATNACLVCWSPESTLCDNLNIVFPPPKGQEIKNPIVPSEVVMWMSCYERKFRNGDSVNYKNCLAARENYETDINFPDPGVDDKYFADRSWWFENAEFEGEKGCDALKKAKVMPRWVPRAANSLDYADMCVVTNTGSDNEDVAGVGELAPGGTGLLNGVCPTN